MREQKKYSIGNYTFFIDDLTLKQLRMITQFEQKLRSSMKPVSISTEGKDELTSDDISNIQEFLITLESHMYSDDMLKFLATILTLTGTKWEPDHVEEHCRVMECMTETTLQEILSDFFSRNVHGKKNSAAGITG